MNELRGNTVKLRLANETDAAFVHSLRIDPRYNEHLSTVDGGVEGQRKWLSAYKLREASAQEFYFIIEKIDSEVPVGTVRLYDFIDGLASFCWGSWILNENKTRYSAIESAMLVYEFGFKKLHFESCHFDVRKGNTKVIGFHEKMGAIRISEGIEDIFFTMSPDAYSQFYLKNEKFIKGHRHD